MATCRVCRGVYPNDQFISGNGPRYLVCVKCGVDEGYVTADEVPGLYDDATAKARLALVARRFAPIGWLVIGWTLWSLYFTGIPLWGRASLVILVLVTLAIPVLLFLGTPKYQAELAKLTPK